MSTATCILQCGRSRDEVTDSITSAEKWENLKRKALLLKGLDKFGDVYERVDWDKGSVGQFVHDTCRLTLSSARKLVQAINRERKRESDESQSSFSSKSYDSFTDASSSCKRLRSSLGPIHDKTKCAWCCKPESPKHPESKLILIYL